MPSPSPEQLLLEVQDVIRSMPGLCDFSVNADKCVAWLGRASAVMSNWDMTRSTIHFEPEVRRYSSQFAHRANINFEPLRHTLLMLLHQAENDLRLQTSGPLTVGIGTGRVFEYFDEIRKLIEAAQVDLFFIDPYIDAEFVSRYLPLVKDGTTVRILARERLTALKPAVALFVTQSGQSVEVRTIAGFHDRYLFIDGQACYHSGASFKDGAKKAPTVLTQVTDAVVPVISTYEQLWTSATPI